MNEILGETLLAGDPVYNDLKYHYRYLDFEHVRGKAQTICTPFTEEHISKRIIETQKTWENQAPYVSAGIIEFVE